MGDVINLREYKKQQQRAERQRLAAAKRTRHGVSKADQERARKEAERLAHELDGKKRDE